jgi:predicted NAD/FAD-binding protein
MRVAIVGAGISGLMAAQRLQGRADLTIFEAEPRPGGHSNTVMVESERGIEAVDTGFIVFNDRNYPEFTGLLEELGVASRPSSMSFSVSDGQFEYSGRSLAGLFATPRNLIDPGYLKMLVEFPRFQRRLAELATGDAQEEMSLSDFLDEEGFSPMLRELAVVPLVSSVWSADPDQMWSFPVRFLARFLDNHGLLAIRNRPRWRTVEGGSKSYVEAVTAPLGDRLRTGSPVEAIERFEDRVEVTPRGGPPESFDQVVMATHSDQALEMLVDPSTQEVEVLGSIQYRPNETVLHTDQSLLPRRRAARACWNYHLTGSTPGAPALTYDMNRLQRLGCKRQFCVTLNRTDRIDPAKVIAKFDYWHPVFTPDAIAAQDRWSEISGQRRTHFCGAYWGSGFHEDGASSGLRVADALLSSGADGILAGTGSRAG